MDQWIHSKFPSLPAIRKWAMDNINIDISVLNQWVEQHKLLSTLLLAIVVFALGNSIAGRRRRKFPPGPWGLPILGYLPFLTTMPHLKLHQLSKKYGDIFQIYIGNRRIVVINSFDLTKETFSKNAFFGRPKESPFFAEGAPITDIFSGSLWKEQRRFILQMIRGFGTEKTVLEENSTKEINNFVKVLEEKKGQPVRIRPMLVPSISNNISSFVFGKRFRYDDPERIRLDKTLQAIGEGSAKIIVINFFPGLLKVLKFFGWKYYVSLRNSISWLNEYMSREIQRHKESHSEDSPKDFMANFISEVKKASNKSDTTFNENILADLTSAFFLGGSETSRTTLEWSFMVLAAFPEIQKRVLAEIDDVIGKERLPMYTDVQKMPYTQAFLLEVMRWKNLAPLVTAKAEEDTEIKGYFIPKDTIIFANTWAIHRDPENWLLPEVFRPERFLSDDGKEIVKPEKFMPFGIGKRACPGEALARAQIYLYLTTILQKMSVKPAPGVKMDFSECLELSLCPKENEMCFVPRE